MTHNEPDHFPDARKMVDLAARIERAEGPDRALERQRKIDMFIRICRDSGFRMNSASAIILLAKMLRTQPLALWGEMGIDFATLERIASGEHPAAIRARSAS